MSRPRRDAFVVVECNQSFGLEVTLRAAAFPLDVTVLTTKPTTFPHLRERGIDIVPCDTTRPTEVLGAVQSLQSKGHVAAVAAGYEGAVVVASTVAQVLGLPGASAAAAWDTRFKPRARALSNELVGNPVEFFLINAPEDASLVPERAFPIVVKPAASGGSFGVEPCNSLQELEDYVARWLGETDGPILVEERIEGAEYSVELFHGSPIALCEKQTGGATGFVEIGHTVTGFANLPESAVLEGFVRKLVDRLDLGWGPIHIELKLDGTTPRLVEVNHRLAADLIPDLIALATGVDLYDATLKAYLGEPVNDLVPQRAEFAAIRFATAPAAGLLQMGSEADVMGLPGIQAVRVLAAAGSRVEPARHSEDRFGYVIATGASRESASAAANRGLAALRVSV